MILPLRHWLRASLFGAMLIALPMLLGGCATGGSEAAGGRALESPSAQMAAFESGQLRLTCGLSCSGAAGYARMGNRALHDREMWRELAMEVARIGYEVDQNYYYLGRAAEGLGRSEAALTYYRLALGSVMKCGGAFNICDGFVFPRDIELRMRSLVQRPATDLRGAAGVSPPTPAANYGANAAAPAGTGIAGSTGRVRAESVNWQLVARSGENEYFVDPASIGGPAAARSLVVLRNAPQGQGSARSFRYAYRIHCVNREYTLVSADGYVGPQLQGDRVQNATFANLNSPLVAQPNTVGAVFVRTACADVPTQTAQTVQAPPPAQPASSSQPSQPSQSSRPPSPGAVAGSPPAAPGAGAPSVPAVVASPPVSTSVPSAAATGSGRALRAAALVIGNGTYVSFDRLPNPINDARAMAERLRGLGISVDLHTDVDRRRLAGSLARFQQREQDVDIGILFYAGHGVEINGVNYLVPVDFSGRTSGEAEIEAIPMSTVLSQVPGRTKLIFLDACRNNPLQLAGATRSMGRGLAPMNVGRGTLVAYATRAGSVAEDGVGTRNSPFTQALLEHIGDPVDISLVLRRVREKVLRATNGKQEPWDYGSLVGGEVVLAALAGGGSSVLGTGSPIGVTPGVAAPGAVTPVGAAPAGNAPGAGAPFGSAPGAGAVGSPVRPPASNAPVNPADALNADPAPARLRTR